MEKGLSKEELRTPRFYQRLQWKLTIRYAIVTVFIVLALQAVLYFILTSISLIFFRSAEFPERIAQALAEAAPQLQPYLEATPPNRKPLAILLQQFGFNTEIESQAEGLEISFRHTFMSTEDTRNFLDKRVRGLWVTDAAGTVLAAFPAETALPPPAAEISQTIEKGERAIFRLTRTTPERDLVAAAPIIDAVSGKLIGVFWVHVQLALGWDLAVDAMQDFLPILIVWPFVGVFIGLACGYLTAGHLTRRLDGIASAAGVWSRGNFSATAPEDPNDELGLLGTRLNRMARDLETRLALQQRLAAVEERNRLARELHDTIKQHLFAASMQISAAQRVIEHDPRAAREFLAESEALTRQMQQDLHEVIQELLPSEKQMHSLAQSLREYTAIWSRRTGIPVELRGLSSLPEPGPATARSLLRIAQEALANIERHSAAEMVLFEFNLDGREIRFTIHDNGQGFDSARPTGGMGLHNMRERVAELTEGRFSLQSAPGLGTRIEIRFAEETMDYGQQKGADHAAAGG